MRYLFGAVMCLLSGSATAEFTGLELEKAMKIDSALFDGYVSGVAEGLIVADSRVFCPELHLHFNVIASIVQDYLNSKTLEELNQVNASSVVLAALQEKYPCIGG